MTRERLASCWGCGAPVPDVEGPTHAYLGASAGCWAVYNEVCARQLSDASYGRSRLFTVNAYAVQHPGRPDRRTAQSVAVHLAGLCLALERGVDDPTIMRRMASMTDARREYPWLGLPSSMGELTVLDAAHDLDPEDHAASVARWARSAWSAWAEYHDAVRTWLDAERSYAPRS